MTKLPVVSGKEMIKYLSKKGFTIRPARGSHVFLSRKNNDGTLTTTTIPLHGELDTGMLIGFEEVDFVILNEDYSRFLIVPDGTIIKAKVVLKKIFFTVDRTPEGYPMGGASGRYGGDYIFSSNR